MKVNLIITGISGSDYTAISLNETFSPHSHNGTTKCVDIPITDDNALEEDQYFTVMFKSTDSNVMVPITGTTVTIIDNGKLNSCYYCW